MRLPTPFFLFYFAQHPGNNAERDEAFAGLWPRRRFSRKLCNLSHPSSLAIATGASMALRPT